TVWRIIRDETEAAPAIFAWSIAVYFFFVMKGVESVGGSNLFTQSMQPSSVAAAATVVTLYLTVQRQWLYAGLVMALGGAFHANYLILNLILFGIVALLVPALEGRWTRKSARAAIVVGGTLLMPSLLITALYLPTVLSVAAESVS